MLDVRIDSAGYSATEAIVSDVHFSIQKGEQLGLIGPNGAGKSTTIKAILGLLNDMKGDVSWARSEADYVYVPERPIFYKPLTLWEHFTLARAAFAIDKQTFETRALSLLQTFFMADQQHHLLDSFSKGMQQKAMLMIALAIQPDLYIIDEPFIGLDPHAKNLLLTELDKERQRGAAVLMSTHVLDTAEKICDRFLLLKDGRLLANGDLSAVRHQAGIEQGSLDECFVTLTKDVMA